MIKKTLVLGLGNDILSDDSIGPRIVRDLASMLNLRDIHLTTSFGGGFQILEEIRSYKRVIIIDAIKTGNKVPGEIHYLIPSQIKAGIQFSGFHDINFLTALRLGESLGLDLPAELFVIAIEIQEDKLFSEDLTPGLKEKYPEILKEVCGSIEKIVSHE